MTLLSDVMFYHGVCYYQALGSVTIMGSVTILGCDIIRYYYLACLYYQNYSHHHRGGFYAQYSAMLRHTGTPTSTKNSQVLQSSMHSVIFQI